MKGEIAVRCEVWFPDIKINYWVRFCAKNKINYLFVVCMFYN